MTAVNLGYGLTPAPAHKKKRQEKDTKDESDLDEREEALDRPLSRQLRADVALNSLWCHAGRKELKLKMSWESDISLDGS